MAQPKSFPVGQAPWETGGDSAPKSFKVGEAPWEQKGFEEPAKSFGQKALDVAGTALHGLGTALDYTYAPIRQAAMIPARLAHGDLSSLAAPFTQLVHSPSSAPTSEQVMEAYGVPKDRTVSSFAAANPLGATAYEMNPMPDDKDVQVVHPAAQGAMLMDMGLGGEGLGLLAKGIGKTAEVASPLLRSFAEHAVVNATGATGKQVAQFEPGAGRYLLDNKLVGFGDSQSDIAKKVADAADAANAKIDAALSKLDEAGVKVNADDIKQRLTQKIVAMRADPSKADVAGLLDKELENLANSVAAKGSPEFGMQEAENIKRGYNRKAGNWMDPEKGQAGKSSYQAWRQAVEDTAQAADPETAAAFQEGKKTYGLLAPIQEAAERRAMQVQQHPVGGFLDGASAAAGAAVKGVPGAIAAPIARRLISPRLASSTAVTADAIANGLRKISGLGSLEKANPSAFQSLVSHIESNYATPTPVDLPKAADAGQDQAAAPTKGPAKWASDGIDNLVAHASDPSIKAQLVAAKDDPKTKDLLIQASDLKPGSAAMDKLLSQIKNRIAKGDK